MSSCTVTLPNGVKMRTASKRRYVLVVTYRGEATILKRLEREQWDNLVSLLIERGAIGIQRNSREDYVGRGMDTGGRRTGCIGFTFADPGQPHRHRDVPARGV